jgi:hypothetical protein
MDSDEPPPGLLYARAGQTLSVIYTLFVWLISHQTVVLYPQNKPATGNQPAVLLSQNKPAPAISHQPNEQAVGRYGRRGTGVSITRCRWWQLLL